MSGTLTLGFSFQNCAKHTFRIKDEIKNVGFFKQYFDLE